MWFHPVWYVLTSRHWKKYWRKELSINYLYLVNNYNFKLKYNDNNFSESLSHFPFADQIIFISIFYLNHTSINFSKTTTTNKRRKKTLFFPSEKKTFKRLIQSLCLLSIKACVAYFRAFLDWIFEILFFYYCKTDDEFTFNDEINRVWTLENRLRIHLKITREELKSWINTKLRHLLYFRLLYGHLL